MATRPLIAALACGLLLAGCGSSSSSSSSSPGSAGTTGSSSPGSTQAAQTSASSAQAGSRLEMGFEGVPIEQGPALASAATTRTSDVDGIHCGPTEQLVYHIHIHLAVYVNGALRALPGGIGIPGSQVEQTTEGPVAVGGQCIYYLHTHAPDGIIHVESPSRRVYTLGNFFDEWHQPLTPTRVGNVTGKITALVNGKQWTKSLRAIPLTPHAVIQFNIGSPPVPFRLVNWSQTQL